MIEVNSHPPNAVCTYHLSCLCKGHVAQMYGRLADIENTLITDFNARLAGTQSVSEG